MKKSIVRLVLGLVLIQVIASSCASRKCNGRRDYNGVKKTYNKSGGFWM
jgi:hypothetical protein